MKRLWVLICKMLKIDTNILFLGSTDVLPPPLSKEEELNYVILARSGNIEARNKLI